jgi:molybdopterin converting factor small subunit
MSVQIEIPLFMLHLVKDKKVIDAPGRTVGECVEYFLKQFPDAKKLLFDRSGKLYGHIDVFVNGVTTFPEELSRPVGDGDRISMLYLIDGG